MTTEEWLAEQKAVWGGSEAFREAVGRLEDHDGRLWRAARDAKPEEATSIVATILDAMAPPEAKGLIAALVRFEELRPAITARVEAALRNGAVPHTIVWIVANAFLRGATEAVERKLPEGLRAVTSEGGAVTVFEYADENRQP